MRKKTIDIGIIGGGPAGLTAALYASRGGASVVVFERMSVGGQASLTPDIENYPAIPRIAGYELGLKMSEHAESAGANIVYDEVISLSLKPKRKKIIVSATEYSAGAVIIATGASPRKLEVEGEARYTGKGVSYCATCDGNFYKSKTVAVCGGGNTAVEDALYLAQIADKVYLIHRRQGFRAEQTLVDKLLSHPKIEVVLDSVVTSIEGEGVVRCVNVNNVVNGQSRSLDVSAIFVAVGTIPNNSLFAGQVKCNQSGCVIVNKEQRTNIKGVFAAGDVTETVLRQVVTAAADGARAASSAIKHLRG